MMRKICALLAVLAPIGLTACVGPKADELGQKWGMMPKVEKTCPVEPDTSATGTARVGWMVTADGEALLYGNGWLEACLPNMKIQWQKYDAGADVAQAFGSHSTDLSLIGSSHMASTLSQPLDLNVDMAWIFSIIGTAESLVVKDPNVHSLRDLKGKTITVSTGSTTHYSLLSAIKQAGMQPTDFNIVFLTPDKMLAGWAGNQLDAAWVWDPTLSKLTETGHIIMSSADTAAKGAPTANVAIVDKDFVAANPQFMKMWWLLQEKAIEQLNNDPDEAAQTLAPILNISVDETKKQLEGYQYLTAEQQHALNFGESLYSTAQFLQDQGRCTVVDEAHYMDSVIIPATNPSA
ncbi:MAG: ABC transporter substrate-binding protein [Corynebacterium sp.]|nr:ABC transporter substrate-binding protein [Corynebacterium sp.]